MSNSSDVNLHTISPIETVANRPVIQTTSALPVDSVINQGLAPQEIQKDLFAYLSPENQARAEKMLSTNANERNTVGNDMFSKTSIVEANAVIPGDVPGRIATLPLALTEQEINTSVGEATGKQVPPVNLKDLMKGNQQAVASKVAEARSSSSAKISFNA